MHCTCAWYTKNTFGLCRLHSVWQLQHRPPRNREELNINFNIIPKTNSVVDLVIKTNFNWHELTDFTSVMEVSLHLWLTLSRDNSHGCTFTGPLGNLRRKKMLKRIKSLLRRPPHGITCQIHDFTKELFSCHFKSSVLEFNTLHWTRSAHLWWLDPSVVQVGFNAPQFSWDLQSMIQYRIV